MKLKILIGSLVMLLAACSSTNTVRPPQEIPVIPKLEQPAPVGSFLERMQNFLLEKQQEQTK